MKLSVQERMELSQSLHGFNSNKTDEIVIIRSIYVMVAITKDEAKQLEITLSPEGYQIGYERNTDYDFNDEQLKMLKILHQALENNSKVNMGNLSLCLKLREIEVKE